MPRKRLSLRAEWRRKNAVNIVSHKVLRPTRRTACMTGHVQAQLNESQLSISLFVYPCPCLTPSLAPSPSLFLSLCGVVFSFRHIGKTQLQAWRTTLREDIWNRSRRARGRYRAGLGSAGLSSVQFSSAHTRAETVAGSWRHASANAGHAVHLPSRSFQPLRTKERKVVGVDRLRPGSTSVSGHGPHNRPSARPLPNSRPSSEAFFFVCF